MEGCLLYTSYGTAAEADGSFTIWMPKQAEGGMRLLCMLPENTRTAEGGTGLFETDITLPVADFEIVYAAMAVSYTHLFSI